MSINIITIQQHQELFQQYPVLDVRSPGEYTHAHIPGAYSLPLFSDDERKIIGTAYKQQSREKAIKLGLDFLGVKMRPIIEEVEKIFASNFKPQTSNTVVVHCWRGGMRSSAVAWLLNFYGFNVHLLEGGYKAFRNWVLDQFNNDYDVNIIGGYTGSGKTGLLKCLKEQGHAIIDLERIACHKGSAFGAIGQPQQPSSEMFENLLATELHEKQDRNFWVEDESQRIGVLNIPNGFWKTMRSKPVFFVDIPFEERLKHIVEEYGKLKKEHLINAIVRIQKRLGPLETKTAIGYLLEDKVSDCFRILLNYYDRSYIKGLHNREHLIELLNKIPCTGVDSIPNTEKLLSCIKVKV
ncbi:MAG: tRNA 2-selenouridine(34) synthase MnmH [Ferruginibacter sp.]